MGDGEGASDDEVIVDESISVLLGEMSIDEVIVDESISVLEISINEVTSVGLVENSNVKPKEGSVMVEVTSNMMLVELSSMNDDVMTEGSIDEGLIDTESDIDS